MGKTTIKNSMTWKLAGTATGGAHISMPTEYNEIMLIATGYSTYYFTAIILKSEITSSMTALRFGTIYNANNNSGGYWIVTNAEAYIGSWQENGGTVNAIPQSVCKLYYR